MAETINITQALQAEEQLATNLNAHMGEWVAIRDHAVVCHARSLRGLLAETQEIDTIDRIFEVPPESGLACFF